MPIFANDYVPETGIMKLVKAKADVHALSTHKQDVEFAMRSQSVTGVTVSAWQVLNVTDSMTLSSPLIEPGPTLTIPVSGTVALLGVANVFTQSQTFQKAAGDLFLSIFGAAATNRGHLFGTVASTRWLAYVNNTAEAGANAGSDYAIVRYSDAAAALGVALSIARSTGAATFENTVTATAYRVGANQVVGARGAAVAAGVNSAAAPTKAEFDALVAAFNALLARMIAHGLISP